MPPTVAEFVGGLLVEILVAFVLYGVTVAQTYFYWYTYLDDPKLIKYLVLALWVLETMHTVFCGHLIWTYLIVDFGTLVDIGNIVWSAGATVFIAMMISMIVQGFLIRRVWILSKHSIKITAVPAIVCFVRIGFGFTTASLTYVLGVWSHFRERTGPLLALIFSMSSAALLDFLVALILFHYLKQSRGKFQRTDDLIKSLMAYTINTGAVTALVSISVVLTFIFLKNSLVFAGLIEIQSKLYANSMLATLNARQIIRNKQAPAYGSDEIELSEGRNVIHRIPVSMDMDGQKHIEIYQNTTKVTDVDPANSFTDSEVGRVPATRKDSVM